MRDWLKQKRTEKGLTMKAIADKLDITESYYSLIEANERQKNMDVALVSKLSSILEVPVSKIVEMEAQG